GDPRMVQVFKTNRHRSDLHGPCHLDEVQMSMHVRKQHWEIISIHLPAENFFQRLTRTPDAVEEYLITGFITRSEKRKALDVVPGGMNEKKMHSGRPVLEFFH